MTKTLIVVVAARISEWIKKGEITPSYFNPDNRFDRVIVISLLEDTPDSDSVRYLCGVSDCCFVSTDFLSLRGLLRTFGFLPFFARRFVEKNIIAAIPENENVHIRSYGDTFSGLVAVALAQILDTRAVASIHTTFTYLPACEKLSLKGKAIRFLEQRARDFTHKKIDVLAPVYSQIITSIAPEYHYKTYVVPNSVDVYSEDSKTKYDRSGDLKIISVGRLVLGKSILPVLRGLRDIEGWHLTIVGDGPCRSDIESWLSYNGLEDRVRIIPTMRNRELLKHLREFDVFVAYTAYSETPKTVIEAGLVGLPAILNCPSWGMPVEYVNAPIVWTDGSAQDYHRAFKELLSNSPSWLDMGQETKAHFEKYFEPTMVGKMMADLLMQIHNDRLRPWNKDRSA